MTHSSTHFLRAVILIVGLIVSAILVIGLPQLLLGEIQGDFDYGYIFLLMYVSAVPFFYALWDAMKLLGYIDHNKAFSIDSVSALNRIKLCGYTICALYALGMPYIFYMGDKDDAPGVVAIAFVIIGASFIVATAAAVIQQLFQKAVDIKQENDLTV